MINSRKESYSLWLAVMFFYFYQYIVRILPNIAINDIMRDFQLNANQFATIGAVYLYAYSLVQIPMGIISDRIGVKKLTFVCILICILGSYLFVNTTNYYVLQLSRVLQGIGSGFSFLCALKIINDGFPKKLVGIFSGITAGIGCFGAIFAGKPLALLIAYFGIKQSVYLISIIGWLSFFVVLVLMFVHGKKSNESKTESKTESKNLNEELTETKNKQLQSFGEIFAGLKYALTNKSILAFAIISVGLYAPVSVLADFWATGFFVTKYGVHTEVAASYITYCYIGVLIGSVVLPAIFDKKIKIGLYITSFVSLFLLSSILYFNNLDYAKILIMFLGFIAGGEITCFTGAMRLSDSKNSGIVIGIMNSINMLGSALGQQFVGKIMDARWSGRIDAYGIRIYSTEDYVFALSLINILIIFGIFLIKRYVSKEH